MKPVDVTAACDRLSSRYDAWYATPLGTFVDARAKEVIFARGGAAVSVSQRTRVPGPSGIAGQTCPLKQYARTPMKQRGLSRDNFPTRYLINDWGS